MVRKKLDNPIWDEKYQKWWELFWGGVKAPWRPTKKEIRFWEKKIKELLKKKKSLKILLLGVTPEIRDLLSKYKNRIEVTLLDLNPRVKRAMDALMKRKNPKEKTVWGDWLKMPLPSNYFDVVFNDEGFENIALKNHDRLHKNIRRVLKKDGYFLVGRACLEYCFKNPLTLNQVLKKYKKDPKFFRNFHNRLWYLYRLCPSEKFFYNKKEQAVLMDKKAAKKVFDQTKKAGIKDLKYLSWDPRIDYRDLNYKEIDLASLKRVKSMIQKHFKIEQIYQDLFHPVMKIKYDFICRPKK